MSRALKDYRLNDRTARAKLAPRAKPYWRLIADGRHLGFRSGKTSGSWIARFRQPGSDSGYVSAKLGLADDRAEADGHTILSWAQALEKASGWFAVQVNRAGPAAKVRSVEEAIKSYVEIQDARATERAGRKTRSVASSRLQVHVLEHDKLPSIMLDRLAEADLRGWLGEINGIKNSSKRRLCADLKAALNSAYAIDRAVLPRDFKLTVSEGLKLPIVDDDSDESTARDNQILDDDTVRRIVAAAFEVDADLGRLVILLAATGARFSQLQRVRVRDVQVDALRLMIPCSRKGRGRKPGHYRLQVGPDVVEALLPVINGRAPEAFLLQRWAYAQKEGLRWVQDHRQPWSVASEMTKGWKKAISLAARSDIIPYALRHSSIVRGLRRGLPIRLVAALHDTSVEMIERHYSRWITDGLEDLAVKAIVPMLEAA